MAKTTKKKIDQPVIAASGGTHETVAQILCRTQGIGIVLAESLAKKLDVKQSQAVIDLAKAKATTEGILSAVGSQPAVESTQEAVASQG